jgi:excisionase family DNA binding protein
MIQLEMAMVNPFAEIAKKLSDLERIALELYNMFHAHKGVTADPERPLSVKDASEFLGIPKNTLYGLTSRREIPFCKKGKQLFFFREELVDWLKGGRQKTVAEIQAGALISVGARSGRV